MPRNAQSAVQRTLVRIGRGSRDIQPFRQGLFRLGGEREKPPNLDLLFLAALLKLRCARSRVS